MNNETPEAALRSRIADLEQQLKLSDEGCSRLASRCLDLEKEVQSYLAAPPPPGTMSWHEQNCKPGSVFDSHLSRRTVAGTLKPPPGSGRASHVLPPRCCSG